jgi:hypothetical protein
MMINFQHLFILSISLLLLSCRSKDEDSFLNKEKLLTHYHATEDSLKHEAVLFLLANMEDQQSQIPVFKRFFFGKEINMQLDTIKDSESLYHLLKEQGLTYSFKTVPDSLVIDNNLFIENIDLTFQLWNRYPWANDIPKDIFFNYLLPYKVYGEKTTHWRSYFNYTYKDSINSILQEIQEGKRHESTNEFYYRILVDDVGKWFKYESSPLQLTQYPGFDELMAVKQGNCFGWSYLNVMILRSLGIPATIDFIPLWGSKNSSHATDVFWDSKLKKLRTASGRELVSPSGRSPAKVFRYSFKNQNIWSDSIKRTIGKNYFHLKYLMHDHWLDVTSEHTHTANIDYLLESDINIDFGYICVFNYGKWEPVFWGKADKSGKTIQFNNMGSNILYRVAIPQKNKYQVISDVFKIDSLGQRIYFQPDTINRISLSLGKTNTGSRSWVEKEKNYSLYYFNKTREWELVKTLTCSIDSIVHFENVPSKALYRLLETNGQNRLERIFEYKNNEQIFY